MFITRNRSWLPIHLFPFVKDFNKMLINIAFIYINKPEKNHLNSTNNLKKSVWHEFSNCKQNLLLISIKFKVTRRCVFVVSLRRLVETLSFLPCQEWYKLKVFVGRYVFHFHCGLCWLVFAGTRFKIPTYGRWKSYRVIYKTTNLSLRLRMRIIKS